MGFVVGEVVARGVVALTLYMETCKWHKCCMGNNEKEISDSEKRIQLYLEEIEADMKGEYVAIFSAFFLELLFAKYANFALKIDMTTQVFVGLLVITAIQFAGELLSDGLSMLLESYALSHYLTKHVEQTQAKRKGPALTRNGIAFYVGAINIFVCFVVVIGNYEKSACGEA